MEKHFAVIGHPIAHSLSPDMHEAGYAALGLAADYERFCVLPERLGEAVRGLKTLGFTGWNVTIPYKVAIIPYLDELTAEAEKIGAVNTVKVRGGKLIGNNTDGSGFWQSLQCRADDYKGKEAVILGAGGAARAIAFALAGKGMKVQILNRTVHKALDLAAAVKSSGGDAEGKGLEAGDWLKSAALVVQTTSVGLKGEDYPFSLQEISPQTRVVDIIFNPWETPFLRDARVQGCTAENGLGMLLYQGVLAWEFWWESAAPVEAMKRGLLQAVGR